MNIRRGHQTNLLIKGLNAEDARDYLADVINGDRDELREMYAAVASTMDKPMQRKSLWIFALLFTNAGRVLTYETIKDKHRLYFGYDVYETPIVASWVKRLRKDIKKEGWPVTIETLYGIGYRMQKTDWTPFKQTDEMAA